MYTISLLTAPTAPDLNPALVDNLRNAWGGSDVVWLAADQAAEFETAEKPENFWDIWAELQQRGVDLSLQTARGRKKQMLLADMDSTMIGQECIDELANEAGVGARVAAITARAMDGKLQFEAALLERVALLHGLPTTAIDRVLDSRIMLAPGGRELVATMRSHGAYCALVSGGFVQFTGPIAARLGFDENRANFLMSENGVLTGDVGRPILGRAAKVSALREISTHLGLRHDQIIAVGDGANDLDMLAMAGTGVALHAKPSVAAKCDIRINHGDLTALLYLQGYSKAEFALKP